MSLEVVVRVPEPVKGPEDADRWVQLYQGAPEMARLLLSLCNGDTLEETCPFCGAHVDGPESHGANCAAISALRKAGVLA